MAPNVRMAPNVAPNVRSPKCLQMFANVVDEHGPITAGAPREQSGDRETSHRSAMLASERGEINSILLRNGRVRDQICKSKRLRVEDQTMMFWERFREFIKKDWVIRQAAYDDVAG